MQKLLMDNVDSLRVAVALDNCAIGDANVLCQPTAVQVRVRLGLRRIVPVTLWLRCISLPFRVGCAHVSNKSLQSRAVSCTSGTSLLVSAKLTKYTEDIMVANLFNIG
jgi:hypothetical protein